MDEEGFKQNEEGFKQEEFNEPTKPKKKLYIWFLISILILSGLYFASYYSVKAYKINLAEQHNIEIIKSIMISNKCIDSCPSDTIINNFTQYQIRKDKGYYEGDFLEKKITINPSCLNYCENEFMNLKELRDKINNLPFKNQIKEEELNKIMNSGTHEIIGCNKLSAYKNNEECDSSYAKYKDIIDLTNYQLSNYPNNELNILSYECDDKLKVEVLWNSTLIMNTLTFINYLPDGTTRLIKLEKIPSMQTKTIYLDKPAYGHFVAEYEKLEEFSSNVIEAVNDKVQCI
jgi:hypothetical protein